MKLTRLLLPVVALSAILAAQETQTTDSSIVPKKEFTAENFLCDPEVVASLNRIHKRTFGDMMERTVVVDRNQVRTSPDDNEHLHATASVNGNSVALIHTHAIDGGARPSETDKALARRLRLPVYVLTLNGLYAAMPDGKTVILVAKYNGQRFSVCGPGESPLCAFFSPQLQSSPKGTKQQSLAGCTVSCENDKHLVDLSDGKNIKPQP